MQTEYARRPLPRITTSVLNAGQVVHKIERNLARPIQSAEEQAQVERSINRQHAEVVEIIRNGSSAVAASTADPPPARRRSLSTYERLCAISGVQRVYQIDNQGNMVGSRTSEQFRKAFGAIFKNMHDLVSVFMRIPGVDFAREKGVYEVESGRLYLASAGSECYFIVVNSIDGSIDHEQVISKIINPPAWDSPVS